MCSRREKGFRVSGEGKGETEAEGGVLGKLLRSCVISWTLCSMGLMRSGAGGTEGPSPGECMLYHIGCMDNSSCPWAWVPPGADIKIAGGLQSNGVIHPVAPCPSLLHPAPPARSGLPSSGATTHAPGAGTCSPPSPPSTPRPGSPHLVCLGQACIPPPLMHQTTPHDHPHDRGTRQAGRPWTRPRPFRRGHSRPAGIAPMPWRLCFGGSHAAGGA